MSEPIREKLQLAVALHQAGRLAQALAIYQDVLKLDPNHFDGLHLSGVVALQTGKLERGVKLIEKAIRVNPEAATAHNNLGNALKDLRRLDQALASYDRALSLRPDYVDAHNNRGNVLLDLKRMDEALVSYDRALSLKAGDAEVHNNRGTVLTGLKRMGEALACYDAALALRPDYPEAFNNRGNALLDLNRPAEAVASYERAVSLRPTYAEAFNNRGNALRDLGRLDEALASYDKALALKPDSADAHTNRGNVLLALKRLDGALAGYRRALTLDPDYPFLFGTYLHTRMMLCDWRSLAKDLGRYAGDISKSRKVAAPFSALSLLDDPGLHKIAAQVYTEARYPQSQALGPYGVRNPDRKIRVGYYSADFHNHATAYLMAELFEKHDTARFEIYGFSFGPDKKDAMRTRLSSAFTEFFDVGGKGDRDIARLSRDMDIDIAVDLKGATEGARTGIFAEGCAPLQVSYLGYPGTMGAAYIDYVIADETVIPPESQADYTEKVVYLPHSYQANDSRRKISEWAPARRELGLPDAGFVFCCFNNTYKILPATFDGWMRILKAVEGSVLWLLDDNATAKSNLKTEAQARGVSGERLVFAKRMALDAHLARHRLADLFLDTLPYNAHTSASDALWAGVPVLTCMGRSFASRVAASLLKAIGLPDLVTASQEEYEAKAIDLATNPAALRRLKSMLDTNRTTAPLFDGALFARHMESAYETMFARSRENLPPAAMEVQP